MLLRVRFVGEDGSLGYRRGKVYTLEVRGRWWPRIIHPVPCPYGSWAAFWQNWTTP